MANFEYIRPEKITLKNHPELNEGWVQKIIGEDPSLLGLCVKGSSLPLTHV